jgi:ABC-2 type transport system permease protein
MKKLLKIEWVKISQYTSFKVIMLLHLGLFFLVVFLISMVDISIPGFRTRSLFEFPHIWESFSWIASFFNLLLAIIMIILVGNEFTFRTFRQHTIDGLGRLELLGGKLILIVLISLYAVILVFASSIVMGLVHTKGITISGMVENMQVLVVYFIQAMAYMSMAMMIALLIRNNAVSIVAFIMYFALVEPVIRWFFSPETRRFFPVKVIANLTPMPEVLTIASKEPMVDASGNSTLDLSAIGITAVPLDLWVKVCLALGYLALFLFCSGLLVRKRNL